MARCSEAGVQYKNNADRLHGKPYTFAMTIWVVPGRSTGEAGLQPMKTEGELGVMTIFSKVDTHRYNLETPSFYKLQT